MASFDANKMGIPSFLVFVEDLPPADSPFGVAGDEAFPKFGFALPAFKFGVDILPEIRTTELNSN
jgi:hypothetical protein